MNFVSALTVHTKDVVRHLGLLMMYVSVCLWALLLCNGERQVKCRIAFQFAPETSK